METLDQLIREIEGLQQQQQQRLQAAVNPDAPRQQAKAATLPIGARVLDLVTGEEGEIIDVQRHNALIPATG